MALNRSLSENYLNFPDDMIFIEYVECSDLQESVFKNFGILRHFVSFGLFFFFYYWRVLLKRKECLDLNYFYLKSNNCEIRVRGMYLWSD